MQPLASWTSIEFDWFINRFSELRRRGVTHRCRPDVKSPPPGRGNFPDAPDSLAFIIALVGDVMFADVAFAPVAFSVVDVVFTADKERADHVSPFTRHDSVMKSQVEFHRVPAWPVGHQEEALPRSGGESRVGLDSRRGRRVRSMRGHNRGPQKVRASASRMQRTRPNCIVPLEFGPDCGVVSSDGFPRYWMTGGSSPRS